MKNTIVSLHLPRFCPALLLVLLAGGCASVPLASTLDDARAKSFAVESQAGNLYVVRPGVMASAVICRIAVDGKMAGSLSKKTYLLLRLPPGQHTVSVFGAENDVSRPVTVQAGQNHFVEAEAHMGWGSARFSLEALDQAAGISAVNKSRLARQAYMPTVAAAER